MGFRTKPKGLKLENKVYLLEVSIERITTFKKPNDLSQVY